MPYSKMACPLDIRIPDDITDFEQYERYLNKLLRIVVTTAINESLIFINDIKGTTYPILRRSTRFPSCDGNKDTDMWGVFNGAMKNVESFNGRFFKSFRRTVYKTLYHLEYKSVWCATHENLNSLEIRVLSNSVIVLMVWYPTLKEVREWQVG